MDNDGLFRELVENFDDILIVTDQEFIIRYVSSSVTRIFGIQAYQVVGKSIFTYMPADKVGQWKQCIADSSDTFKEEISLVINGSKNYFDVQVSNFLSRHDIKGLVLKLHDITSKKSRERELKKANDQLDQVIYKTTHDLKAPLMSAIGLVSLAEKAPESEKSKYIELIKKSLRKLDGFIDEMSDFFRHEKLAIQSERIDLHQMLNDEITNLQTLHQDAGVNISLMMTGYAEFTSDSIRVRTIVGNILSNAIKYRDAKKAEPFIKIHVFNSTEICEIRFIDNGIGIEPQYLKKIFELFFRATTQSQGTGLGLFIVKDTVEKLKGSLEVQSKPGEGTTFILKLPNHIIQPVAVD